MTHRRRVGVLALLLAALTAAAYAPAARNGFVNFDDGGYIYQNPETLKGLTWGTARWALTSTEQGNWLPLARLSHLADVSLFGLRAGAHHLVSVGWHAAAAVLLFVALLAMTGAAWRSFFVAALFAVHPVQVESVAWAAERKSVLAGFFFALTLLLWARHARRPGPGRYAAALAAGALGLASKPSLVTLPFLLLLLEFWPLGRMRPPGRGGAPLSPALAGRRVLEQAPLLLLAAAAGAVAVIAHRDVRALGLVLPYGLEVRLGNAALSCARYLGTLLWPADLAVFYPHPGGALPWAKAAAAGALAAALTALALARLRRRPWLATGWLWFLGMLAPTIGVLQFGLLSMADRYLHLPLVGVGIALAWSAAEATRSRPDRGAVLGPPAAAALAALAALTVAQVRLWRDDLTLFSHAVAVTSGNWSAEYNLAVALHQAGRPAEAVGHYRAAVRDFPLDKAHIGEAIGKLAGALLELGRREEAAEAFRELARARPTEAGAFYNLGNTLAGLGRHEEAAAAFRDAVRVSPGHARAHNNLGSALYALGRYAEAAAACAEAVRLDPGDPVARNNLARALGRQGRAGLLPSPPAPSDR